MHDQKLTVGVGKSSSAATPLLVACARISTVLATESPSVNERHHVAIFFAVLSLCLSLLSFPVRGQGSDPNLDYYKEPGQYPTRSYLNQSFSEHIDPFTGRLQHHYVDLFIPGNGGFDLKIQRSYTNPDEAGPGEPTPFGIGWTMHFGRILRASNIPLCFTDYLSGNQMPVLELADGSRQVLFRDDTYFPNQARFITVNRWRAECMTAPAGIRVYAPDGTRYEMTQSANANVPAGQQGWYTTRITDRNGNYMTVTYRSFSGLMVPETLSTSDGRTVTYAYDSDANGTRLRSISDGARTWNYGLTFTPTVGWFLTSVTPPAGEAWQYLYNTTGGTAGLRAMTRVTYPQGGTINYSYILQGFATGISNSAISGKISSDGGTWSFAYKPGGALTPDTTTATTPNGTIIYQHVGYQTVGSGNYWQLGLLVSKSMALAGQSATQTESYTWTSQFISQQDNHRPGSALAYDFETRAAVLQKKVIVRDGNTHTTDFSAFDAYGNAQSANESSSGSPGYSRTLILAYQPNVTLWIIRQVKDETIRVSGFTDFSISRTIGATGNLELENRYGVPTTFGYDNQGNMTSRTDARGTGYTTTFSNYKRGIPQTETYPVTGITVTRVVSNNGTVTSETDGAGHTMGYSYDGLNRLTSINYPVLNDVTVNYPTAVRMTIVRGTLTQTVDYDGFGRMASVAKADTLSPTQNSTVTLTHNALGQRTFVSYPNTPATGTAMTYDVLDRLKTMTHPGPTTRTYTYGSTTVAILNERKITHTYSYRAYADPDQRELMGISIPSPDQAASVTITRNPIGRILTVAQGGKTRTYGYTAAGQFAPGNFLTSIVEPETGTTTFGRDAVGNMTSRAVGSSPTTTYVYDQLSRLTQVNYPGLPVLTRTYFGDGLLKSVGFGSTLREFAYNANKSLTMDRLAIDGRIYSVTHAYAGNDGRSATTFPSGTAITLAPNGFGRPTSATPFASAVEFHPSGEVETINHANGMTTTLTLDARLWPRQITTSRTGATVGNRRYTYDGTGNVIQYEDLYQGANSMPVLQYDNVDRLKLADTAGEPRRYAYDGSGNMTSQTIGTRNMTYTYGSNNLLTGISNAPKNYAFSYDVYGNVINNDTAAFQYDDASHMTCSKCGEADETTFVYDGLGMRVRMQKQGVKTYFLYGIDGELLLEETPSTFQTKEYAYLQGRQIGRKVITRTPSVEWLPAIYRLLLH